MSMDTNLRIFTNDVFSDIEEVVKRARKLRNETLEGTGKIDAEYIDHALITIAEKLVFNFPELEDRLNKLRKPN